MLVGVALALVGANLWWFTRGGQDEGKAFELTPTFGGEYSLQKQGVPLDFDADTLTWTANGRVIAQVGTQVKRELLMTPLDGERPQPIPVPEALKSQGLAYVPVHDDPRRTVEDMRRLLLSLVKRGVCQVGLVDQSEGEHAGRAGSGLADRVELYGIIAVRSDTGQRLECTPSLAD
ncbi:hypothetical protein [Novosphingobium mangrovi (ex Hu et al. 2023)]|uniref:Uncharacterized protein n=1 Tax=Novosphingobium mangrovi (ex Hu et al. 2023) TaxID=2930094 RepID=A0ABT0A7K2_9SPHN|nr:hypothetical protein [Novosphingobium mangrovi (ex Hu et al. 2023)]MCJ1959165.1 hypothetical protein [Novosphingobium mangrovi (ex Hu et al. 2023)]